MSVDKEAEILKLIEKLTTTGKKTLDEDLMKKLKSICKVSNDYVSYAYYALMTQLRKEHSEIRYSVLLIINELFCRSSVFRKLLEVDLEEFMELVAETDPENPLPLPRDRAKELKLLGLEFMKAWTSKFGEKYVRLEIALTFLRKCKKVDFNDMEARSIAQREQQRREEERQERIVQEKVNKVKTEMQEIKHEISSTLLQMENCFRLLIPPPTEELFSDQDFINPDQVSCTSTETNDSDMGGVISPTATSEIDAEETDAAVSFPENSLRHHGIHDMKKTITIEVMDNSEVSVKASEDNLPVIENLNDLHKQMGTTYYPMVTNWLKVLTKGSNCTDFLKQAIDLKQLIESIFEKYKDLKIKPGDVKLDEDDEDDDFVEVKEKEGYEAEVKAPQIPKTASSPSQFSNQPSCSKDMSAAEKAFMWKLKYSEEDLKDPTCAISTLSKRPDKKRVEIPSSSSSPAPKTPTKGNKAELLNKAPVRPYDIDLYHWEDEKPVVPQIVKFDALHKFWESKNDDEENEALTAVQLASLRTRKIDFSGKFEPVKWSCRAPLPSGKLCPRKDRYKCPFHGKIVRRDSAGNPEDIVEDAPGPSSSETSSTAAVPEWQDPELLRDIEAATGIDLKLPQKRGKKGKQKSKQKKQDGLTNIKSIQTNTRDRLNKKIIKRYKHYAKKLDDVERKLYNDKFGDQWNYY